MARIIVYVNGGNVQAVVSDSDQIEVMIVDYDNERTTTRPKRYFEPVNRDIELVDRTIAFKE